MPHTKPDPEKFCDNCKARLSRKRINGRMEDMAVFVRRRYCNRACMAAAMLQPDPSRKGYGIRARKHLKSNCENCGTTQKLSIHHADRNWKNNDPANLKTLCTSCHTSLHHAAGEISPKQEKPPCRLCGRVSYRSGLCNTCRTRMRRSGQSTAKGGR